MQKSGNGFPRILYKVATALPLYSGIDQHACPKQVTAPTFLLAQESQLSPDRYDRLSSESAGGRRDGGCRALAVAITVGGWQTSTRRSIEATKGKRRARPGNSKQH